MAKRYSADQMIEAIRDSRGNLSTAADRLECTRQTVYNYAKDLKTVQQAIDEERERMKDHVESKLYELIDERHPTAIIFYLKTQGKDRGYVERQQHEVTGKDGGAVTVKVLKGVSVDDL